MNRYEHGKKDDPLIFLQYISGVPLFGHSKIFKLFLAFMAVITEVFMLIGVLHYFYKKPEVELWKYAPFFFLPQGFIWLFVVQILVYDKLADISSVFQKYGWSIKSTGEETFLQISAECKHTIVLCHFASFIIIFVSVLFFPFVGDESEWQYPTYLVHTFPKYLIQNYPLTLKLTFNFVFAFAVIVCGTSFIPFINLSIYALGHLKVQYQLLNASIIRFGCRRAFHINDIRYQERVARQLKFCIKRKLQLDQIYATGKTIANYIIVPLSMYALNNFVFCNFFIVSGISPASNFRMYTSLAVWFSLLTIFCKFCQQLTDETEEIYRNLCKCHWENWNNQNRRTLLIMLLNASKPITVTAFVDVNYTLISKMYRVGNVLVSLFAYNLK